MMELKITLDDAGNVNVNGPLENRMLCYGLLEIAKEVIARTATKEEPRIQPALVVPHFGRHS